MEYIDYNLFSEWKKKDSEGKIILVKELLVVWDKLDNELREIWKRGIYKSYTEFLFHDGSNVSLVLYGYVRRYEKEKLDHLLLGNVWYNIQKLVDFIKGAEVFIRMMELEEENRKLLRSGL